MRSREARDSPGGAEGANLPASAGDAGLTPHPAPIQEAPTCRGATKPLCDNL